MQIIEDRNFQRAAVILAAKYPVEVVKIPCSPRCAAVYSDTPETRALADAFDHKRPISTPAKDILNAYGMLMTMAKDLKRGSIATTGAPKLMGVFDQDSKTAVVALAGEVRR
jgi:hypothetical protein